MSEASPLKPMYYPNEVQLAVLSTGLPDYDLARDASVVADYSQKTFIYKDQESKVRSIYSVTGLSLNTDSEATFRTATFGVDPSNSRLITQLDSLGQSKLIDVGVLLDEGKDVRTSIAAQLALKGLALSLPIKSDRASIGGVVTFEGPAENTITSQLFLSQDFIRGVEELQNNRAGRAAYRLFNILSKLRSGAGEEASTKSNIHPRVLNHFVTVASVATLRPGGPVVVSKPLNATI